MGKFYRFMSNILNYPFKTAFLSGFQNLSIETFYVVL